MLPAAVFLLAVFIYPLAAILLLSVTEPTVGLQNFVEFFETPFYTRILWRTYSTAFVVTILTLVISYPIAFVAARVGGALGTALIALVTVGFWTSGLIPTF